jgi:hypothetical protein
MGEIFSLTDNGDGKTFKSPPPLAVSSDIDGFAARTHNRVRLADNDARYKASGFLPADFQITGLTDSNRPNRPVALFEKPASQALESPPALSESLKLSPYDSAIKLNVQITNVPEVSAAITNQEIAGYGNAVLKAGAAVMQPITEHLSQPNAVNEDLNKIATTLDTLSKYFARHPEHLLDLGKDLIDSARQNAEALFNKIDKPMMPTERASMAGGIIPLFVLSGKLIHPEAAEELGLANMTETELDNLGIKRFEMPQLKLESDEFSIKASVPGDEMAWFQAKVRSEGIVEVNFLKRGALPFGTGSKILAEALKLNGKLPTKTLAFTDIIEPSTYNDFLVGTAPEATLLGKCGAKALKELGLTPASYKFEFVRNKLNMVIEVK